MSYYILPKKNNTIALKSVNIDISKIHPEILISHSIYFYINSIEKELLTYISQEKIKEYKKLLFSYQHLSTKEVCLTNNSIQFYTYIELLKLSNFFDIYKNKMSIYCNETIYESFLFTNKNNITFKKEELNHKNKDNISILCFDVERKNYVLSFISVLCNILFYQIQGGSNIIKIYEIIQKPIIEIIYVLNSLYEKVYIIKPNMSDIINEDRYLVCKNLKLEDKYIIYSYFSNIYKELIKLDNHNISLLNINLPYYFLNKLEESNIGIGNQKIEQLDVILSLVNDENIIEKTEKIKINNLHKCTSWCEKHKIQYKQNEKINIFTSEIGSFN
jgi:hypothetical protein